MSEMLSRDEELELLCRAKAGDSAALHRVILAHRPLLYKLVKRYTRFGVSSADLVNEGYLAMLYAARRFDPTRGTCFATYALWWMRYYLHRFTASQRSIVGGSKTREARRIRGKLVQATHDLTNKLGHEPSATELAAALDADVDEVLLLTRERWLRDAAVESDENDAGVTVPAATDDTEYGAMHRELSRAIDVALESLTPRERDILRRRYREGATLGALGEAYGVSRERIRQIQARAFVKLRQHSALRDAAGV